MTGGMSVYGWVHKGALLAAAMTLAACGGGGGGGGPAPSPTPVISPTPTPTALPTATPTATPTAVPTATPTATPTSEPTATPTPTPTATVPPTPVPSGTSLRGALLDFVTERSEGTVTGNRLEAVDDLTGARFTVTVLSEPSEAGDFGEAIDISDSVRTSGADLAPGEFEIDTTTALATLNADPRLALQSFISSQIALNAEVVAEPVDTRALVVPAKVTTGLVPFASTLIDISGDEASERLELSRASGYVVERFQARVRAVRTTAGTAGVSSFLASAQPLALRAPRVALQQRVLSTPVVVDNRDAVSFAELLAEVGYAGEVEGNLDTALAVNDADPVAAVSKAYHFMSFEPSFHHFNMNAPAGGAGAGGSSGSYIFRMRFEIAPDPAPASATGLRMILQNEADSRMERYGSAGAGYRLEYDIENIAQADFEPDEIPASLGSDGLLSILVPGEEEQDINYAGDTIISSESAQTLRSPASPNALRALTSVARYIDICDQAVCTTGPAFGSLPVGAQGDIISDTVSATFGLIAPVLDAPLNPAAVNGGYGLVGVQLEFDPDGTLDRRRSDSFALSATFAGGVGSLGTVRTTSAVANAPAGGSVLLGFDETVDPPDAGVTLTLTAPSLPVYGNGQVQLRITEPGEAPFTLYGFASDAEASHLVMTPSVACREGANDPALCGVGEFLLGDGNPVQPFIEEGHQVVLAVRKGASAPTLAQLAGRYQLQGVLLNHYTNGEYSANLLLGGSVLTLGANGSVLLEQPLQEIHADMDGGPVYSLPAGAVQLEGAASVGAEGVIEVELADTAGGSFVLKLTGFAAEALDTLVFGLGIHDGVAPNLEEAGAGIALGHRLP